MERAAAAKPHAPLHIGFMSSPGEIDARARANLALSYFLIASRRKTMTAPNSSAAERTIPVIASPQINRD